MSGLVLMVTDIMVLTLALAYLTICKIGMAVTMLFFPIYVACLVFSATRQWFYSWLNTMLSFMFTYLLVISLISFLFSSLGTMLNEEIGNPFQIAVDLFNWGGVMIIHVIFFVLLLQARSWAAALTNGAVGSSGVAHQTAAGAKKLIMKLVTKGAA